MKRVGKLLFVSSLILSGAGVLSSCEPPPIAYDDPSIQYMGKTIYNAVACNNVETEFFDMSGNIKTDTRIPFSKFIVHHGFYFTAELEMDLNPFFPSFDNFHYEFVLATIQLYYTDGRLSPLTYEVLVMRQGDVVYPFCFMPGNALGMSLDIIPENREYFFASTILLSSYAIVNILDADLPIITLELSKEGVDIDIEARSYGPRNGYIYDPESLFFSADSYIELEKEEVLEILIGAMIEEKQALATIISIDLMDSTLLVESSQLPSLKSIRFTQIFMNGLPVNREMLQVGSTISFYYYELFDNYAPSDLFVGPIYIV